MGTFHFMEFWIHFCGHELLKEDISNFCIYLLTIKMNWYSLMPIILIFNSNNLNQETHALIWWTILEMNSYYLTIAVTWSIKANCLLCKISTSFSNKNTCCWLIANSVSSKGNHIDNIHRSRKSFDCSHSQNSVVSFLMETKYWKYLNNTAAQKCHHKEHYYGQLHHCCLLMAK